MKKKINELIKEYKSDIKEYHLKRINKDFSYELKKDKLENSDEVIDFADNWEFSPDMDLAYIMGAISALNRLLR